MKASKIGRSRLTTERDTPPRRPLFRKYFVAFFVAVLVPLLVNGASEAWLGYQDQRTMIDVQLRVEAARAADQIDGFLDGILNQLVWTVQLPAGSSMVLQRRLDALRLLRQVPAITELTQINADGKEQLRVSRLTRNATGSGIDHSKDSAFIQAVEHKSYYGPVYFFRGSEPYMKLALAGERRRSMVSVATVNLKLIWDVISKIKVGKTGEAFVVDSQYRLIAHPDISRVLRGGDPTDSARIRELRITMADVGVDAVTVWDAGGRRQIVTVMPIAGANWTVFVQQPLSEAFAPIYAALWRTGGMLVAGAIFAGLLAYLLARHMVGPIRRLEDGAVRIGRGEFSCPIEVSTGDELEALATRINTMAGNLRERELIRDMFGKFVPESVAKAILHDQGALEPQTRVATILFTDIVGFSSIAESIPPECVVQMLNEYFSAVVEPIERNGGVIEQFQGDAVFATYNLPIEVADHAAKAVRTALEIQDMLAGRTFDLDGHGASVALGTRIGINTGIVVGGTVGSGGRLGYTVHGDAVNVASRIEQLNKQYGTQILVAQSTVDLAGSDFRFEAVGEVPIRGRHQPVTLYRVRGMAE